MHIERISTDRQKISRSSLLKFLPGKLPKLPTSLTPGTKVLKGILAESKDYYLNIKAEIQKKLRSLPSGSVKERIISGREYYYMQRRKEKKVVHEYLGKERPDDLLKKIRERRALQVELKKVNEALKVL